MKKLLMAVATIFAAALAEAAELEKIVVTPSRMAEKIGSASCSISVVDEEDFEREKIHTVRQALQEQVGVDVRQSGAFQGQTDLLIRGGSSNQALILVDGLKAYDPIAPGGEYNLAHLTLDNVERIEILRGPQSAAYGSDAMAGVVNIISKKAEDTYVNAQWEGGSFYTSQENFEAGSVAHGFHYSIAGSRLDTKGISQAEAKHGCYERDFYDRTAFSGRADYDIGDKASVGGTIRYTKAHFAFDQGADADDDNAFCLLTESFITLFGEQRIIDRWSHALRLGWMESMRQYFDEDSPPVNDFDRSKYAGKYFKLDYTSTFEFCDFDRFLIGYEYTEEQACYYSTNDFSGVMATDIMPKVFAREGDFYFENRFNYPDKITATQGLRIIHHSLAGTHLTYRVDGSYTFPTKTKIRGLVATGFKAPSLYQLHAPASFWFGGGNPNLNPEESFSYEYGADQNLWGERIIAGITYFHTLYRDLIDAITDPTTWITAPYTNIGKAQVHGIEAAIDVKPIDSIKVKTGFTYMKTKDFQNDQEMVRRPERKFFIECFWQATKALSFDLRMRYNGPMSDNLSNPLWALNTYKVKEFVVADAVVNYDISKNFSFYMKANNLFNKHYEEVRGYCTSPFALYGGIKARF
ncbi:MAG: TonB-dependent receptor [Candidatus Omnitrophica bacterium]|nr:TonB-dependent receptor [Candidatus Omnitrophota bacterium]